MHDREGMTRRLKEIYEEIDLMISENLPFLAQRHSIGESPLMAVKDSLFVSVASLHRDFKLRMSGPSEAVFHYLIKNLVFEQLEREYSVTETRVEGEKIKERWKKRPNVIAKISDGKVIYIEAELGKRDLNNWMTGKNFDSCLENPHKWRPDIIAIGSMKGMFLRPVREGIARQAKTKNLEVKVYEIDGSKDPEGLMARELSLE